MRFAEQNKKKIDPRYFLNEDIQSDMEAAAREMGAGQYRPNPALAFDPTQKAVSGTEKLVNPFYSEYSALATKSKGFVKCPNIAGPIQAAAVEVIKGVRPELVSTPALIKRLTDGKVGATTLQMINVALKFAGKPVMPVSMKSFQQVCNLNPVQVKEIVGYMNQLPRQDAEKIAALLANQPAQQATGTDRIPSLPPKRSKVTGTDSSQFPPSVARETSKTRSINDTPKEGDTFKSEKTGILVWHNGEYIPKEDYDQLKSQGKLEESKARDASYNALKEQKNKKLFEALIKG